MATDNDFNTCCSWRTTRTTKWLVLTVVGVIFTLIYIGCDFRSFQVHVNLHPTPSQNSSTNIPAYKFSQLNAVSTYPPTQTVSKAALNTGVRLKTKIKGDVLFGKTNTGYEFEVALDGRSKSLEFPFTAFFATLTVVAGKDVVSAEFFGFRTRVYNYTLSLGPTRIPVKLMLQNRKVRTTTITMHRHPRPVTFVDGVDVEVCYLEQDCGLIIYSDRKCGLQAMKYWSVSEYVDGYWRLKCNNCSQELSCLWSEAEWVEVGGEVTAPTLPDEDSLRTCFKDHQLLFVGDSTLRAMLQTIMERTQGYLIDPMATMSSARYNDIGYNSIFSLTYYNPYVRQERVTFDQRLRELSSQFQITGKENKTFLLVGGTQWLTESHIQQVKNYINKTGIPPSNVFIKLYTSGFHITGHFTEGKHLRPSSSLMESNKAVKKLVIEYGFQFVDPLQLTLSRYREFLQGWCACHFHGVNGYQGKAGKLPRTRQLYHMVGDLNTVYTHILLKRMCPRHQK